MAKIGEGVPCRISKKKPVEIFWEKNARWRIGREALRKGLHSIREFLLNTRQYIQRHKKKHQNFV